MLARLGRAPLGFRGACALTRARRSHGKRELRAGLAPERAEVGPTEHSATFGFATFRTTPAWTRIPRSSEDHLIPVKSQVS